MRQHTRVFEKYQIKEDDYIEIYSEKAALIFSTVIANLLKSKEHTLLEKYKELKEIMTSKEYEMAICYGGMEKITKGIFLSILKRRNSIITILYFNLSKIKKGIEIK